MEIGANIEQFSREQLLELVKLLIAENEKLRADITQLKAELEQLKRQNTGSATPFSQNKPKKNPKRPGRKRGKGNFRNRTAPAEEDYSEPPVDIPVGYDVCPDCGGQLGAAEIEIVSNTELPPIPKPIVKVFRLHKRKCGRCRKTIYGRHPEVVSDQHGATAHRLGPRAQSAAHILHHDDGIPVCKVPGVLYSLTGLQLTKSAITQSALRHSTGKGAVAQEYQRLRRDAPNQERTCSDDTGWRSGGRNRQLMVFDGEEQTVYQIRQQHRNEEVREVIGDNYQGTLVTDRGTSYDAVELADVKQQKCLPHIFRTIDKVLERKTGRACAFGAMLSTLLREALELYHVFHDPEQKLPDYDKRVRELENEISFHLRPRKLVDPDNQRLLNEIGWHHERGNLLRFLHEPTTVPPTNNAAERALRPAVIARKVSQCSKNDRGAESYAAFKSVIVTMKKKGGNLLEQMTRLLSPSSTRAAPV